MPSLRKLGKSHKPRIEPATTPVDRRGLDAMLSLKPVPGYHDIIHHRAAFRWLSDLSRRDPVAFLRLTGPNSRQLRRLYGRRHRSRRLPMGTWQGWHMLEHALEWEIWTGPTSTVIHVKANDDFVSDPLIGVGIVGFLKDMRDCLMTSD